MNSDIFSTMAQNHSHVVQFLTKLEFEKVFVSRCKRKVNIQLKCHNTKKMFHSWAYHQ